MEEDAASATHDRRNLSQSPSPLGTPAVALPIKRGRGRPRGRGRGRVAGASSRKDEDFQDRDYKPPPRFNNDIPLSLLAEIPRRSVRTVMLQTRPKEVDDRERRRETYLYASTPLVQDKLPKPGKPKGTTPPSIMRYTNYVLYTSYYPPPPSPASTRSPTPMRPAYCPVPEAFVAELDNFTCRWKGCPVLNEFEDLEALSDHLLLVHIKTQKGLRGKRKNARGFICTLALSINSCCLCVGE